MFPLTDITPWKLGDWLILMTEISLFEKSRKGWRISKDFTQFDTCRQTRSTVSNILASSGENEGSLVFKSLSGKIFHRFNDPMQSIVMERFVKGMKIKMPIESGKN